MPQLYITKAKPNPWGKDRLGSTVPSQQLAGEWIQFINNSTSRLSLNNVIVEHVAYSGLYDFTGTLKIAYDFRGTNFVLGPNESVRIHSGGTIPLSLLSVEDRIGADHHKFTGKSYIWNNDRNDTVKISAYSSGTFQKIDSAWYSAYPTEGKVLLRQINTDKLA